MRNGVLLEGIIPHDGWQCSITFDGKDKSAEQNADMYLFLEEWENNRIS